MNIEENFFMKPLYFLALGSLLTLGSCGFFKDYSKDNHWSYFEEWDSNTDMHIDKEEFANGCIRDGFIKKDERATADNLFTAADESKDGELTGIEFYRWKVKYVGNDAASS